MKKISRQIVYLTTALLILSVPWNKGAAQDESFRIAVSVHNLVPKRGYVMAALHNNGASYLSRTVLPFRRIMLPVQGASLDFRFENLPRGQYSITVYQDLNSNQQLDSNFLGMPREPFGFSRNPVIGLGPPEFQETAFKLNSDTRLKIKLSQ
ncbi:MAG: DUF2141 domain-containing protein [Leptospiraceae bacterium]|nr:DUF2141 domain-containing protein [Leptospiraceae bacterium]